jgi:myo-inositol-1(or 4)-monophosphatase
MAGRYENRNSTMTTSDATDSTPSTPDNQVLDRAEETAIMLAREAGALIRDLLHQDRAITHKGMVDLVTDADHASEEIVAGGLSAAFPEHRLIGEEGSRGRETSPYGWLIDPIDGTTNYAHRYPHFAVSIALEFHGEPVLGVVYDPMRDELFWARLGGGAFLNDEPIRVSATTDLIQSLLATGFSYNIAERTAGYALWTDINSIVQGVRRDGAAALNMCYVAAGRLDGYFERPVNPWDIGAGAIVVREAGGTLTNLDGEPFGLYDNQVIATNGLIHDELTDRIQSVITTLDVT